MKPDPSYVEEWLPDFWVMDDHRWALYAWEVTRRRHPEFERFALVHVDYHFDGCYDINDESQLKSLHDVQQIRTLIELDLTIRKDSFIAPAVVRGYLSAIHFFCPQTDTDPGLDSSILERTNCVQHLHSTIDATTNSVIPEPIFFDLCLDLFNRSNTWYESALWSEKEIAQLLARIAPLVQRATVVTCSLSFGYSGSEDDTRRLAGLCIPELARMRGINDL